MQGAVIEVEQSVLQYVCEAERACSTAVSGKDKQEIR